jgi:hypothetical protein
MSIKATLSDIQEEARRVYGSNHFIEFEQDGTCGASVTVGLKNTSSQVNQICCESWYYQNALDAALAALKGLPSNK